MSATDCLRESFTKDDLHLPVTLGRFEQSRSYPGRIQESDERESVNDAR